MVFLRIKLEKKLLKAIKNIDVNEVKEIIEQANSNNVTLKIQKTTKEENDFLFQAIEAGNSDIIQTLIDYAKTNHILLKITEPDDNSEEEYPLLQAVKKNGVTMTRMFIDYVKEQQLTWDASDALFYALNNKNVEIFQMIMDYATKNEHHPSTNLNLNLEVQGSYALLAATIMNDTAIVNQLIDYADQHGMALTLNKSLPAPLNWYPLAMAVNNNNMEMVKRFMDHADKNKFVLDLNAKEGIEENYPMLSACRYNNTAMIQLLMDYAEKHDISLEMNAKSKDESREKIETPLACAVLFRNTEMARLILEFADKQDTVMHFKEGYLSILWMNEQTEMMKLLYHYHKKQRVQITFHENSYLLEKFNEMKASEENNE